MPFAKCLRLALVPAMLLTWAIPSAIAQAADPHGPLFGGDVPALPRGSLDLTMSLTKGQDDDLSADLGTGGSPLQPHVRGSYEDLDGGLSFSAKNRTVSFTARATGTARRTPGLARLADSNGTALTDVTVNFSRRLFLTTSLSASHVSSFAFDTFAQQAEAPPAGEAAASSSGPAASLDWRRTSYGGSATLTRLFGRTSSFSLIAGLGYSERPVIVQQGDAQALMMLLSQSQAVTMLFSQSAGRQGVFRVSYTYGQGQQTVPDQRARLTSQDVQLSLERTWRHSKFRRTVVTLSAGPSLLQQRQVTAVTVTPDAPPVQDLLTADDAASVPPEPIIVQQVQNDRLLRGVGTVIVSHDLARTWSTQAWFRRGTGVQDAVFFSNAAGLDIRGRFGRRISVGVSGSYNGGDINIGSLLNRFSTASGSARLQVALARRLAFQGQYFFYHYEYRAPTDLPEGLLPRVNRRGLRVGVVLWAPLKRGKA
jgi:hypothetical protein